MATNNGKKKNGGGKKGTGKSAKKKAGTGAKASENVGAQPLTAENGGRQDVAAEARHEAQAEANSADQVVGQSDGRQSTTNASTTPVAEQNRPDQSVPVADSMSQKSDDQSGQSYEDGVIRGLQEAILARMEKNGPVTDQMRRDVEANVYHDSLINWIKSF